MDHRVGLEVESGVNISPSEAASDLITRFSPTFINIFLRIKKRFIDIVTPDPLEIPPPAGIWRQQKSGDDQESGLFDNVLVAVTGDEDGWPAVEYAAKVAQNEAAKLIGLHIRAKKTANDGEQIAHIEERFGTIISKAGVDSSFMVNTGKVTRTIYQRSLWSDLLVLRLSHAPPVLSFRRFGSGLRNLIRLVRTPILFVPPPAKPCLDRVLLAYGGGRKAEEALYVAAYFASRWHTKLVVVTVRRGNQDEHALSEQAQKYLLSRDIHDVEYLKFKDISPADAILHVSGENECDLILTGGYEGSYFRELIYGSTVDLILQRVNCSVLICH
jgi:nucleotide-binding universal stress UspA family protein